MGDEGIKNNAPLTKKEKAQIAGRDVAEGATKGIANYYGGPTAGKVADMALQTKVGQKVLDRASKKINRNPLARNVLAKNQEKISSAKPIVNSMMGGMSKNSQIGIENNNTSSNVDEGYNEQKNSSLLGNNNSSYRGEGTANGIWNKLPIKTKLTLLGIGISVCSLIIFIVILITPLMELGIIDISDIGSSIGGSGNISGGTITNDYTSIPNSTSYWWPVGGSTSNIGGVNFANSLPYNLTITSNFGIRKHPITGKIKQHSGIDIVGGINIIAVADGKVIYPGNSDEMSCPTSNTLDDCGDGYGNYVMIRHNDGNVTLYAHLYENSITVRAGDTVKQGQLIAKMGSSGNSTGTHLHFEVRVNNTRVEPLNYISTNNPRP